MHLGVYIQLLAAKSHMKQTLIIIFILFLFEDLNGQDQKIHFQNVYDPNSKYITVNETTSKSTVSFQGPENEIKDLESYGISNPMKVAGTKHSTTVIETFNLEEDGRIQANFHIKEYEITQNDEEVDSSLENLLIKGSYDSLYHFKIDSIISEKFNQEFIGFIKDQSEELNYDVNFPDKPLSLGESFSDEKTVEVPIAGMTKAKILKTDIYTFRAIEDDIAIFDVQEKMDLNMDMNENNILLESEGNGVLYFNLREKFVEKNESNSTMSISMKMGSINVQSDVHTVSNNQTTKE